MYGSMEGKKVLELTKKMHREKEEKEEARKSAAMKRQTSKEAFFRCKLECVCLRSSGKCDSASLKQCSVCHNILRSQCSKNQYKSADGMKPVMIHCASAQSMSTQVHESDGNSDEDSGDCSDIIEEGSRDEDIGHVVDMMKAAWRSLSPPL